MQRRLNGVSRAALSLGGRPYIGHDDYYHIADLTIDQIRAYAGARGSIERIGEHAVLQFRVTGGTAVILGALDTTGATETLRDSAIMLIDDRGPGFDRRSRYISATPPPN